MGLDSVTFPGHFTKGIKVIKVLLTTLSTLPELKSSSIACIISFPTIGQTSLRRWVPKPSIPGNLSPDI